MLFECILRLSGVVVLLNVKSIAALSISYTSKSEIMTIKNGIAW